MGKKVEGQTDRTDNMIKNVNKLKIGEFNVFEQTFFNTNCILHQILIRNERLICKMFFLPSDFRVQHKRHVIIFTK